MTIHQKFARFVKLAISEWANSHLDEYHQANNKDEFLEEQYDLFVDETFNDCHDWYHFSPQDLTIDDIQALLSTHADHCEHQKEYVDFTVPPPTNIHDLLVNFGYHTANVDNRVHLYAKFVEAFNVD